MATPLLSDHWECTGQQQAQRHPHPHVKAAGVCVRHSPSTFKTAVGSSRPVHADRGRCCPMHFRGAAWQISRKTLSLLRFHPKAVQLP